MRRRFILSPLIKLNRFIFPFEISGLPSSINPYRCHVPRPCFCLFLEKDLTRMPMPTFQRLKDSAVLTPVALPKTLSLLGALGFAACAQAAPAFDLRPLLVANLACTMAMMAFVSLIGPIARILGLAKLVPCTGTMIVLSRRISVRLRGCILPVMVRQEMRTDIIGLLGAWTMS